MRLVNRGHCQIKVAFKPGMVRLRLLRALYRFVLSPVRTLYLWSVRPTTHGARLLVTEPETDRILLIRQSYGDRDLWMIPGGGYDPGKEDPGDAAVREAYEETGVRVANVQHLLEDESLAR